MTDIIDGKLVIPEGVEYIQEESYHGSEELEELFLPDSLRVIGPVAFAECPNLCRIRFGSGLEEICDGAFVGAMLLARISLPDSLRSIGQMAFLGCGLTSVSVPENTAFIGESCFWDCPQLVRADVLGRDCVIEADAFGNCPRLTEGYIAPGFPSEDTPPSDLLFSLLWASEHLRHEEEGTAATSQRAAEFIRRSQAIVLETILRTGNTAAMSGIRDCGLFDRDTLEKGLRAAADAGMTELTSLFLSAKNSDNKKNADDPFEDFNL